MEHELWNMKFFLELYSDPHPSFKVSKIIITCIIDRFTGRSSEEGSSEGGSSEEELRKGAGESSGLGPHYQK